MNYILSGAADKDLEEIYTYGHIHFGEYQAKCYVNAIEERIGIICDNPQIGRLDARAIPAVYRFECESHIIFYDITDNGILIVRILHGATDYVQHL